MNQPTFVSTIATLTLSLALSGCGSSDSHAAQADKADSTETALSLDGAVNLNTAFALSMNCSAGAKPYSNAANSGPWSVSFDSDQLTFAGPASVASGRFSTSGNPVVRRENELTVTLETTLGQTGGRLWFERQPDGAVVNAGLSGRADGTSIECGAIAASQWLPTPAANPFSRVDNKLFWNTADHIQLHCATSATGNLTETSRVAQARLSLTAGGALTAINATTGAPEITLPAPESDNRTASFVHESSRMGGLRVWLSQHDSQPGDNIQIQWRLDFSLLSLAHHHEDGSLTRCVPAPLDPRGSITG